MQQGANSIYQGINEVSQTLPQRRYLQNFYMPSKLTVFCVTGAVVVLMILEASRHRAQGFYLFPFFFLFEFFNLNLLYSLEEKKNNLKKRIFSWTEQVGRIGGSST
jgi:hypothetical protein